VEYKNEISVKCRLGLGLEEDIDYIFSYLSLFSNLGIKTIFIHCRNGVLNLDTKKNRTIPTINYELFLRCKDKFPDLNLIPNGEINTKSTFDFFVNHGVTHFMIGRQFAKDILFPEKIGLYQIKDKKTAILKSINEFKSHKFFNLNLIKKSIFTLLNDIPNSKNIRKEITIMEDINSLRNYFESNEFWN
jgi:tRNA-dihydrouridine synthase A